MTFDEYQKGVKQTANTAGKKVERLCNWSMGLTGECGEVVDILKKSIFHGHELDKHHVLEELGDVLYYLTIMTDELGASLEQVAEMNNKKLMARYEGGFSKKKSKEREC